MKKLLSLLLILLSLQLVSATAWPADAGVDIHSNLPAGYEPSGVVWHPHYNSLFLVSDGGLLSKMNLDGTNVVNWNVPGDLEGVTITSADSEFVYVLVEYPYALIKFNPATGQSIRSVSLTGVIPATVNTNSGLEGVTFVPNGYHPYANSSTGGLFYVGVQETGAINVVDVDFVAGTARLVSSFVPVAGRGDIAGLNFNTQTNTLSVLYDANNLLREITVNNALLNEYDVPGFDQEGVTIIQSCPNARTTLVIAEDSGRVMKYGNYPVNCPHADADGDGFSVNNDCNDNNALVNPGRSEILYNGVDDDCNPLTPDTVDADADGFNSNVDCNDNNALVNPNATEVKLNLNDDDCNPQTSDDLVVPINEIRNVTSLNKGDYHEFTKKFAYSTFTLLPPQGTYQFIINAKKVGRTYWMALNTASQNQVTPWQYLDINTATWSDYTYQFNLRQEQTTVNIIGGARNGATQQVRQVTIRRIS